MFDGDGPMSQWPGTVGIVTVLMCVDISEFLCMSGCLDSAALVLFQAAAYQLILKILNLVTSVESPTVALFHNNSISDTVPSFQVTPLHVSHHFGMLKSSTTIMVKYHTCVLYGCPSIPLLNKI
jgi:hypothetical protein